MNHRKIAEIAHVSTSTVSKALSGSKEISTEVAEEIKKIAIEIGYFTEKNKRNFKSKRKQQTLIAVLCPEIISIHYSKMVTLIKSFVEERGGRIAVYIHDFDSKKKAELIEAISIDNCTNGIILISSLDNAVSSIPIVSFESLNNDSPITTIGADMNKVMYDIIHYLYTSGHRKIGFVGETLTTTKEVIFKECLSKFGIPVSDCYIYRIDKRFEDIGKEAAKGIINSNDRPTAIITAYDEIAVSLIYDLEQAGINVPEDISVVGMNDIPLAPYIKSSLTTVRFFYDEQAALAVDILYENILGISNEVQHLEIKHELVIRNSTKRLQ